MNDARPRCGFRRGRVAAAANEPAEAHCRIGASRDRDNANRRAARATDVPLRPPPQRDTHQTAAAAAAANKTHSIRLPPSSPRATVAPAPPPKPRRLRATS